MIKIEIRRGKKQSTVKKQVELIKWRTRQDSNLRPLGS